MQRIDRNAGRTGRGEPGPELVVIFDINGAAHAVVRGRPDERPEPLQPEAETALSPEVIRRWLA